MIYRVAEYNWDASEIIKLVTDEEKEKLLEELETLPDDIYTEIPEGWTDVEPPTESNYRLVFNWETNEWVETAEWFEKLGFESEEEAYLHEAEQHVEELLKEHDEKRVMAEKQLLNFVAEQYLLSKDLTDEHKQMFTSLYPLWLPDMDLSVGDKVVYEDDVYEVIQKHVSQLDWLPSLVPALYKIFYQRVVENEDGDEVEVIPNFVQPIGSHDSYNIGDKVLFDGKVYESVMYNNVWSPSDYAEAWRVVMM